MAKIIMEINGREYESIHDWASLDEFFAADFGEDSDEFGQAPDYSAGGQCHYRMAE